MRNAGTRLRQILQKECVATPGAFNGLCGRLIADHGFKTAYISGAAVTASAGVPDIGILTLDHFSRVIREVSMASGLPLMCDADTGFGESEMMCRTVAEYIHAGAGGLHLEDQVFPKRCGHLDNKKLVTIEEMCEKVERAKAASIAYSDGEFVICARTDAYAVEGFDCAVQRATAYVKAGADMIFPEGLGTVEDFKNFSAAMDKLPRRPLLLANMTEFGKTPYIPVKQFGEFGYNMVIFPVTTLRCAMKPVEEVLELIKTEGSAEKYVPKMFTRAELYSTIRYTPGEEWTFPSTATTTEKPKKK